MNKQTDNPPGSTVGSIWHTLKRVLVIAIAVYVLYRSGYIIGTILAAVVFSYIALPLVDALCKTPLGHMSAKGQRMLATIFVFILLILVVWLMVQLMLVPFGQEIRDFNANLQSYTLKVKSYFNEVISWYSEFVPQQVKDAIARLDYALIASKLATATGQFAGYLGTWLHFLFELILIPVFAFYFVLDYHSIGREFYGLFPRRRWREALRLGRRIGEIAQSYVVGQLILCIIAGVFTTVFLAMLGMPYVVVLGLFAGITRAIPIIGPIVSGVPIIMVGILNSSGPAIPLTLLIFTTVIHFVESKFIMPKLIGKRLHLHPAVVLIVLLVGAEFFGLIGMFVAAPIAAIARDMIRFYYIGDSGGGRQPHAIGE